MKKYLPAMFALSAPVVFVLGVIVYVTFFTTPVSPNYDFIVTERYMNFFYVKNNKIEIDEKKLDNSIEATYNNIYSEDDLTLWYYSIEDDNLRKIDVEEAQQLAVDGSKKSPDGFEMEYLYSRSIADVFSLRSQRGHYILKDNKGYRLNIDEYGMNFIGWVIE